MRSVLTVVVVCAAGLASAQVEEGPAVREPADPAEVISGATVPDPTTAEVGFGGSDLAGTEAGAQLEELQLRVRELESAAIAQSATLQEAASQLQALQTRLAEEEQLSADEPTRTLATHHQAAAESRDARAAAIEDALSDIEAARELVEAGNDDLGPRIAAAVEGLDAASAEAGQWNSAAEAERLTRASVLISRVPGLIESRNFDHAMIALVAARELATQALALTRSATASDR